MNAPAALRIRNLSKTFPGQKALDDVDLDITPGEIHALVGQNGSGKSTIVKILAGYHEPDDGAVAEVADVAVRARLGHGRARRRAALRPPGPRARRVDDGLRQLPDEPADAHPVAAAPQLRAQRGEGGPRPPRLRHRPEPHDRRAGRVRAHRGRRRPRPRRHRRRHPLPAARARRGDGRAARRRGGPAVRGDAPRRRAGHRRAVHLPLPRRGAGDRRSRHDPARRPPDRHRALRRPHPRAAGQPDARP